MESALDKVHLIEDMGYDNLVISIKSSDVMMCARAHELIAAKTDYPLHVGITESGTLYSGNIKSAVGLGIILYQGIGDTIRVSPVSYTHLAPPPPEKWLSWAARPWRPSRTVFP